MASSDGGSTADQILGENGVGQNNDYTGDGYGGSEAAVDAIEAFVDERVTDQMVVSSRSIANGADVDARVQEIGKTLGARLNGAVARRCDVAQKGTEVRPLPIK
jgi:hypothetical protein